ncbi:PGAP1-like protein [Jatrophihabitans endophyticus]|uniref:PGAP1-like protein n=2 Tax=Jatrophihabitans endophyticus TaxID=1206085 RepID=A0A1M5D548_9ACTN|nr:PGAP1-like protein [Jatrophihabitans endophyticus]
MRDAGTLAGTTLHEVAGTARDVHRAVADRLFGLAGRPGAAIKLAHDGIAAIAYGSTRLGVRYLPPAVGMIAGAVQDPTAESVHDHRTGRSVLGAISGIVGDRMAVESAAVAPQMRMRLGSGPLRRVAGNVAHDARSASVPVGGRLVVFVHGLCESDLCWSWAAERRWGDRTATYGSKLHDDDGWTPLYVNFNTGLHISGNGLEFAEQLEELVAGWPVRVTEIALIGHSLGGLVARSAAHQGHELGHAWVGRLRHIVGLGTPHLGAPLERYVNRGTHRLARRPETRPFAALLNQRSVGIKDLRHGSVVEADWLDFEADDPTDNCTPASLVPGVAYSMVSATLSREPDGIFAHDLLVQHGSAHGVGAVRSIAFEADRSHTIAGGKHHFDLLADATVYDKVRGWLAGGDGAAAPVDSPRTTSGERRRSRSSRPRT